MDTPSLNTHTETLRRLIEGKAGLTGPERAEFKRALALCTTEDDFKELRGRVLAAGGGSVKGWQTKKQGITHTH